MENNILLKKYFIGSEERDLNCIVVSRCGDLRWSLNNRHNVDKK